ncbi:MULTISPECIES: 1-phosphofructokinase [Anaerofustis]|uniref:1-phosphofructokinase n=1 Tax=Anaerofustis TaxID=264995 RepID=UPI00110640AA|nr:MULTISPECIES: 1-phosphofructokinase [Anaerofustis]MCO8193784.1 1-phosphofructokinase [Anaerofustis sp. NSJ-163]
MIYTVTFNPALDYVMIIDEFKSGNVNRCENEFLNPGGKGINVSTMLSELGEENVALGFIAGFTGRELVNKLNERNIKTNFIELKEGLTRINVKIKGNIESEINAKGPNIDKEDLQKLLNQIDTLKDNDILVLAGSIPSSIDDDIYEQIMKRLSEKNVHVVVDATKDLLKNVLKYKPFLIKPNHHELAEFFDVKINSDEEIVEYAKKLQEMGAENVLVSMAADGAILVTKENEVIKTNTPKGKVVNSVGAGDSMVAGFIYGYLKNKDYKEALRFGSAAGSASAFSESIATKEKVEELLKEL